MYTHKFIFALWLVCPLASVAQVFTGNWYGRAETKTADSYNTYLCELVATQKGNTVKAKLNYYFGKHEWSANVSGAVISRTQTFELEPFKLVTFFSRDANAADCNMDGSLTLYTYEGDTILYGQFNPFGNHRLGCPVMTVMLRKEKLEETRREDFTPPPREELETSEVIIPVGDTIEVNQQDERFNERTFTRGSLFEVNTDTIEVHLYDNARVDNDTVTVYFNRKMVAEKQRLSLRPVILRLALKPGENEIAMFAENIGDIPPNTALCIIYAGSERYDINLSSTLLTNGTVRVRKRE